jgi:hypothetical protein
MSEYRNTCSITGNIIYPSLESVARELAHLASTTAHLPPAHRGGPSAPHRGAQQDPRDVLRWLDALVASGFTPIGDRHRALFAYRDALRAELEVKGV